ncbi:MAG: DUF3445 domain-containing protein [Alphaproteobacteria bacterium]|nr:MAG: DUF3445 domain-containing protein [Alphaproteobacteria bacterium]
MGEDAQATDVKDHLCLAISDRVPHFETLRLRVSCVFTSLFTSLSSSTSSQNTSKLRRVFIRLDTSPENYHRWGIDKASVTPENVGDKVHLRVELQALWRLPRSNAIVFSIRCYLIKMDELVTQKKWARRFHRVLASLPQPIADYKGLARFRDTTTAWLSRHDDGLPTSPGFAPD